LPLPGQNAQKSRGHEHQRAASRGTDPDSGEASPEPTPPVQLDTNAAGIALAFLLGSATARGASAAYRRFFKRIKNAEWITPDVLRRRRWITGIVTSVGDADNFRLYHTPGFGWRGLLKFRHVPVTYRGLRGQTIHIRMAGMDAPEGSHFGRSAQPYAAEALAWLKENVEGRRIKCQLLRRDQYNRVVALPLLPRAVLQPWRWRWTRQGGGGGGVTARTRNLPLEMVRAGWGAVYVQKGAEYGSDWEKEAYLAAEAEAQAARRGMWQNGMDIELPSDYKKRHRMAEVQAKVEEEVEEEPVTEDLDPKEQVGFWRWIFGRRKRRPS
jgi:endonuclease YncB( thermonuclease family)